MIFKHLAETIDCLDAVLSWRMIPGRLGIKTHCRDRNHDLSSYLVLGISTVVLDMNGHSCDRAKDSWSLVRGTDGWVPNTAR